MSRSAKELWRKENWMKRDWIEVYHNSNFIEYLFSEEFPKANELTHVANVQLEDKEYERAFELTNHIDHAWQDNPQVEALTDSARSTSVGDVIRLKSGLWMVCRAVGWDVYPPELVEEYGLDKI